MVVEKTFSVSPLPTFFTLTTFMISDFFDEIDDAFDDEDFESFESVNHPEDVHPANEASFSPSEKDASLNFLPDPGNQFFRDFIEELKNPSAPSIELDAELEKNQALYDKKDPFGDSFEETLSDEEDSLEDPHHDDEA